MLVAFACASVAGERRFGDGVHRLTEPICLTAADSGMRIVGTGRTVLSGARKLEGCVFRPCGDGVWKGSADLPLRPDVLFVGGRKMRMARFPNAVSGKDVYESWNLNETSSYDPAKDPLLPARVARWRNPSGAYLHVMHHALWGDVQYIIDGVRQDGSLERRGGGQMNRVVRDHPVFRYVENVREELDSPGEWHYDAEAKELLVYPYPDQDMGRAEVEYAALPTLISIEGATNVVIEGVTLTGTSRTFMDNVERMLLSDWTLCRKGAVTVRDSADCRLSNCDFEDLGGNAVVVDGRNCGLVVTNSLFREIGASGVVFAGRTSSVRSPRFDYETVSPADFATADVTPGPANDDYPRECEVVDSLFVRIGREEKQTAAVTVFASAGITVRDCTVRETPRAGINIGTGAFGGHLVEGCDVFDTVLETGDHGAFNSWGRDRFWQSDLAAMDAVVPDRSEWVFLDAQRTTVLRRNRWRCDHGWDVDLDDGSSNYLIEENVMLAGGLKLREGYRRLARGNYLYNNSLHIHCWLRDSHDVVTNNVLFGPVSTAGRTAYWGDAIVPNVTARPGAVPPMPAGRWGVRSPRLRALAGEPGIPAVRFRPSRQKTKRFAWRGMSLRTLDASAEFSAFGVTPATEGFVVESGARAPFADGDLLLGRSVPDLAADACDVVRRQRVVRLSLSK